jgi:hypothetical protein
MRRTVKIFALILFYFLACGKSCDNNESQDAQTEQRKVMIDTYRLRKTFDADTLSGSSLVGFMERAKQEFSDYNDYLDIVADTSKARPFRDQARKMITRLFLSGEAPANINKPFRLISVSGKEGFHPVNDSVYSGRLEINFISPQIPVYSDLLTRDSSTVAVFLVKHSKDFGKEKLRVWDVFLGKME